MIQRLLQLAQGSQTGLSGAVIRGARWTTIGFGLQYAIRLGSTVVLTRLLTPDDFGLMSLSMVFLTALMMMSDVGLAPSVIRSERGEDPAFLRTVWTLNALRGLLIALMVCLIAYPVARIYEQEIMFPLLCVLALSSAISGWHSVSEFVCRRKIDLARLTAIDLGSQVIAVTVTIVSAWMLGSVWALAIGTITASLVRVSLTHAILPSFSHRLWIERGAVREVIQYGRWILAGTLLTFIAGRGGLAIMGVLVSIQTVGLINIASTIAWALGDLTVRLMSNTTMPALATIARNRPADLRAALRKLKMRLLLVVIPCALALSVLARPIVDLLYDDRYALAGEFLSLLALDTAISIASMPYSSALLAIGNSRAHAQIMFLSAVFRVLGLIAGFHVLGPFGMILGLGLGNLVAYAAATVFARRAGIADLPTDALSVLVILALYAVNLTLIPF